MFRPSRRACVITLLVLAVLDIAWAGTKCRKDIYTNSRFIAGTAYIFSQFETKEQLMRWMATLTMITIGNLPWWARHVQSATEKDKKKKSKANFRNLSCSTKHLVALAGLLRSGCWFTMGVEIEPVKYFSTIAVVLGALGVLALKGNNQISKEEGSVLKKYYEHLTLIYTGEHKFFYGTKYTFATLILMAQCFSLGTPGIHACLNFALLVLPNCRTGNTSFLCLFEDNIIEKALDLYYAVSRGVRRRTTIGDNFQEVAREANDVLERLRSAAVSGPVGMAQLVGDDEDLGGAATVPLNAKPLLLGFADKINAAASRIDAVRGVVDLVIRDGADVQVLDVVTDGAVADDAVEAARILRSFSGSICGLGDVVAGDVAVELVENIIKTCEAAASSAYLSVIDYLHSKADGTIDLKQWDGGVIIDWLREQGYNIDVSDVREKIEIAANDGQRVDRLNFARIIKENPEKKYKLVVLANAVSGKGWKDGDYSHCISCEVRADDLRLGKCNSVRAASEALLTTPIALLFAYVKASHCSSISGGPVRLDHADAGAVCAITETRAFGGGGGSPWTLSSMTGRVMLLLDDQDTVVAMSDRRMTPHGASAYFLKHRPPLPVRDDSEGVYTAEPLAQNLVELVAVVKTFPTIESLVLNTSLTTGAGTFLEDYKAKIRLDLQNVDATEQELNHAVHNERVAAAEAALELDTVAKFVVKASAPIGVFDVPQENEARRSVLCSVWWQNPSKFYFPDGLVVEGSSGLDAAASHGLSFSPVLKVFPVDLVVVVPEYDQYLVGRNEREGRNERPIRLNFKNELTMREQNRVVYDGYLAAVIAGGPRALQDPGLRARYAVYAHVKKAMPPSMACRSEAEREAWKAKEFKEWVVRPRVA